MSYNRATPAEIEAARAVIAEIEDRGGSAPGDIEVDDETESVEDGSGTWVRAWILIASIPYQSDGEIEAASWAQLRPIHTKDDDCDVDPATDLCRGCGVLHGAPCSKCGARGFHVRGCGARAGAPPNDGIGGHGGYDWANLGGRK